MTVGFKQTQKRYLQQIALVRRPNTVSNFRTVTSDFIRYLESNYPCLRSFSETARCHVEGWLRDLACRPLRRNTRRNKIIKLRVFFETLQSWGWHDSPQESLFRRGDLPPEERLLPKPLSEETDRLLSQELQLRGGMLHKALLLARATGLRSQELLDLRLESLKSLPKDAWALHVPLGKLHSERVIPVDRQTARVFLEISQLRGTTPPAPDPETGKPANFLLVRKDGRRYHRDALRYQLIKIEKDAHFVEHPTPHRLRHTYATEMLRSGMALPILMNLLGHRTIAMTLRYTRITDGDVRKAYAEALEVIAQRYELPSAPAASKLPGPGHDREAVVFQLGLLAVTLESYRRGLPPASQRKQLQRLVERIRRITADFKASTQ